MSLKVCCKVFFLVVATLGALTGCALVWAGTARLFSVSLSDASNDQTSRVLSQFIKCDDIKSAAAPSTIDYQNVVLMQCYSQQAPVIGLLASNGVAGLLSVVALLTAIIKNTKGPAFVSSIFAASTFAVTVITIGFFGVYAGRIATTFIDCRGFSSATISLLTKAGDICVFADGQPDKTSAVKWLEGFIFYYAGAFTILLCVLVKVLIHSCCPRPTGPQSEEEGEQRMPLMAMPPPEQQYRYPQYGAVSGHYQPAV